MNFRYDIQIKTAIRAMQEVVIPAVDSVNRMAVEQAGLVLAMLQLLERTLPLVHRYDCAELEGNLALVAELRAAGERVPSLVQNSARMAAVAAAASATLDRPRTDPQELAQACRDIRSAIADFVTLAYREAPARERQIIARLTLASTRKQLLRERAWVISQGWESEPEKLQPIELSI